MLPVTIWMNMPSFYQGDLFRALVTSDKIDLQVIYAHHISNERRQLGWQDDVQGFAHQFLSEETPLFDAARIAWAQRRRFHIVNGIWAEASFATALITLISMGGRFALYSEAPRSQLSRTFAKRLIRSTFGRLVCARAAGALPVSHFAADFFLKLGMRHDHLYPFGYFRASVDVELSLMRTRDRVEVIFVGQVIHRKGLDLLLDALCPIMEENPRVCLAIVGSGDQMAGLQSQARQLQLEDRIAFEGSLSSTQIMDRIRQASILVLPSRWDGWGLVVNEALAVGTPVVVSDQCGAAELIHDGVNGRVFASGQVGALRDALADCLDEPRQARLRKGAWQTGQRITTDVVAPYLVECVRHMCGESVKRPRPPWVIRQPGEELFP